MYKHKLAHHDVKVISATEAISDTPEGALMEGLLEMFAEMYSKDLIQFDYAKKSGHILQLFSFDILTYN